MNEVLAVEAVDVTKTFGSVHAVDNISVRVAPGEVHGVAGFIESPRFYPYLTGRANLEGLALLDGGTYEFKVAQGIGPSSPVTLPVQR